MKGLLHWIKNAGRPLLAYWLMTAFGLTVFSIVATVLNPGPELIPILGSFWLATLLGQVLGNGLGYLRPRFWIATLLIAFSCLIEVLISPALAALGPLAPFAFIVWFMLPFTILSGFFAVRNRMEIFGAWIPTMYAVGGAVMIINAKGKVAAWKMSKWAVWDVVTVPILAGAILFFVVYLVMRQAQSLSLWQESVDLRMPSLTAAARYKPRARISWMTWGCVGALAILLTCSTAVVSPFLFRTATSEDGKGGGDGKNGDGKGGDGKGADGKGADGKGGGKGADGKGGGKGANGNGGGKGGSGGGKGGSGGGGGGDGGGGGGAGDGDPMEAPEPDWDKTKEGAAQAAQAGLQLLLLLLLLLLIALIFAACGYRPSRREALLRHLESPTVRVAPSKRVENLWRRAVIALSDIGIKSTVAEPASALAARAVLELKARYGQAPEGLIEAAAIYTRVHYNLGIEAEDDFQMASNVNRVTRFVGTRLDFWAKAKNYYRAIPPWE
jgi:hypothetical protein